MVEYFLFSLTVIGNVIAFVQAVPGAGIATFFANVSGNRSKVDIRRNVFIFP